MSNKIYLVYDHECPVCQAFCRMSRIRESIGKLVLINAREESDIRNEITALGLDIDQGMVLKVDDNLFYGSDAMNALALMSSRSGFFNRTSYWLFRSPRLSKILYPVLRAGRNILLKLLGKTKINNLSLDDNHKF